MSDLENGEIDITMTMLRILIEMRHVRTTSKRLEILDRIEELSMLHSEEYLNAIIGKL